ATATKTKPDETSFVEAECHPIAVAKPQPIPGQITCGNLAEALAKAQQKCRAVEKDEENTYHKYGYASAEAIIIESKQALADCGLALVPVEQTLDGYQKEGEGRFELVRKFLLMHSSGESLPIVSHWPVIPDRGRPLDKATA